MKIAYLGFDFFSSCLDVLVKNGHDVKWIFSVKEGGVYDNKYNFNQRILALANEIGAKLSLNPITENDIREIMANGCDLIVSAAYPYKIPVFDGMPKAVNIHPALLPNGRGGWPLPLAILKNLKHNGVTIHKVFKEFDTGDILIQKKIKVFPDENLETISCRSQILAKELIAKLMGDFNRYWKNARPQVGGEYWPIPNDDERTINWNENIADIDRKSRAFGVFCAKAIWDEKTWWVHDVSVWKEKHKYAPGDIVHTANREIVIAAADGFACIRFYEPA